MSLIIYTIVLFLISGIIGHKYYGSSKWNYIDSIYYPLGAIGIIVLFMQESTYRDIINKNQEVAFLKKQIELIDSQKPNINNYLNEDNLIDSEGEHFFTISKLADVCKKGNIYDSTCRVAKDISIITNKYEKYFLDNRGINRVEELCNASYKLINDLENSNMPLFIINNIREYHINAINKGYNLLEYEKLAKYLESYKNESYKDIYKLMDSLNNFDSFDKKYYNSVKEDYINYVDFGYTILSSFKSCSRAPNNIRNGDFRKWKNKKISVTNKEHNITNIIKQLESNKNNIQGFWFKYFIWPFIIILALALKFAKAISSITRESKKKC